MCSCAPHIFLAHALGLGLGLMAIAEWRRQALRADVFWLVTGMMSLVMAIMVFHVTRGHYFYDFTKAYWPAGEAAWQGRDAVIALYQKGVEGFVNIPILAYLFAPFALIPPIPAALLLTVFGVVGIVFAWAGLSAAANLDAERRAKLMFVFASFGPLIYSVREGNTSHLVLTLIVFAFLLLRQQRDILAGALLGAAALIKLPLMLFGIYFVLRGRWNAVIGGGSMVGSTVLLSLLVFGWPAHLSWYELSVQPHARDPIPALNVQSIAGALARLELGGQSPLDWTSHQLSAPLQTAATASTLLLLSLAVASALAPRRASARMASKDVAVELEFLIVLMLACIISPLSWSHYYSWMLMPIAFFIGRTAHFSAAPAVRVMGWIAIVLAAAPVTLLWFNNPHLQEIASRAGASQLLIGGLLLLTLLIWSRWQLKLPHGGNVSSAAALNGGNVTPATG